MRIAVHDYAGHPFQFDLSRSLAARGHIVRHFYFAGDLGPKGRSTVLPSDPAGFSIVPVGIPFRYNKSGLLLRYVYDLFYGLAAVVKLRAFRADVVISGNTPPGSQWLIHLATRINGRRFVFWVQDFYSVGVERVINGRWSAFGRMIVQHFKSIERGMLERSDAVVLISPDFLRLVPPTVPGTKLHVVQNWGTLEAIRPANKRNTWSVRHGVQDRVAFIYTGTLGRKHDPGLLLSLADAFGDDEPVVVVVAANGVNMDVLRARNAERPRRNLILLPLQPIEELSDVLGAADVLVTLLEADAGHYSVPSKMLSYLCSGRPILLSAPPENLSTSVLRESNAGLAAPAGEVDKFVAAARQLRNDPGMRRKKGAAARVFAEAKFDMDQITARFEHIFESAIRNDWPGASGDYPPPLGLDERVNRPRPIAHSR